MMALRIWGTLRGSIGMIFGRVGCVLVWCGCEWDGSSKYVVDGTGLRLQSSMGYDIYGLVHFFSPPFSMLASPHTDDIERRTLGVRSAQVK